MQHAIFKSAVRVNNQEESDVVEELCKKYSLPIWPSHNTFEYLSKWITRNPLTDIYFYFRYLHLALLELFLLRRYLFVALNLILHTYMRYHLENLG